MHFINPRGLGERLKKGSPDKRETKGYLKKIYIPFKSSEALVEFLISCYVDSNL